MGIARTPVERVSPVGPETERVAAVAVSGVVAEAEPLESGVEAGPSVNERVDAWPRVLAIRAVGLVKAIEIVRKHGSVENRKALLKTLRRVQKKPGSPRGSRAQPGRTTLARESSKKGFYLILPGVC